MKIDVLYLALVTKSLELCPSLSDAYDDVDDSIRAHQIIGLHQSQDLAVRLKELQLRHKLKGGFVT